MDFEMLKNSENKGVFYDDTHDNIEDLVAYSADSINRYLKPSSFQFEYTINKLEGHNTYKVTRTCKPQLAHYRVLLKNHNEYFMMQIKSIY